MVRFFLLMVLTLLAPTARTADKTKVPVYKTPRDVFIAKKKALEAKDWRTLHRLYSKDSQKRVLTENLTGTWYFASGKVPGLGKVDAEIQQAADQLLTKHGFPKKKRESLKVPKQGTKAERAFFARLAETIKDGESLTVGFSNLMIKLIPASQLSPGDPKDLKVTITGDRALGIVPVKIGNKKAYDLRTHFKKVGQGWKLYHPRPSDENRPN